MKANRFLNFARDEHGDTNTADVMIGIILIAISLLVTLAFVGPVADQSAAAKANANVTGASDAVLDLVPLIFIIVILLAGAAGVFFVVKGFRG